MRCMASSSCVFGELASPSPAADSELLELRIAVAARWSAISASTGFVSFANAATSASGGLTPSVPRHREIAVGLARKIRKDLEIPGPR